MKKTAIALSVSMLLIFLTANIDAKKKKPITPKRCRGAKRVTGNWVKKRMGKVKIFDVRKVAEYLDGHIKGAVSAPYKEKSKKKRRFKARKDKLDFTKFPKGKRTKIVVYCNGPRCWKSYKACVVLVRKGYRKVYWYRNGFPEWKTKNFPTE